MRRVTIALCVGVNNINMCFDATIPSRRSTEVRTAKNGFYRRANLQTNNKLLAVRHYLPLHSPLLRESWLVFIVALRWLICLSLARILARADVQYMERESWLWVISRAQKKKKTLAAFYYAKIIYRKTRIRINPLAAYKWNNSTRKIQRVVTL